MKALMDTLGLAGGPVRPPLTNVDAETAEAVRDLAPKYRAWHGNP
jgi:dihydrodipicolinate synthase/N-acetylneuraminate lyase